ncbi:MAG: hypothetical protein DRN20_00360 [Thermoplasmata archaeon]|nr:MAG: hypothetical protein DRN20_00360 [Thermoplasmata archaeon]
MSQKKKGIGRGAFRGYDIDLNAQIDISYGNVEYDKTIKLHIDIMVYSVAIFVFSSCGSGTAIYGTDDHPEWNLKGTNRIIITSTNKNEHDYCWAGSVWTHNDDYDHQEFLWNEENNGFIWAYKNMGIISLKTAFDSGYNAAQDNDWEILGNDVSTPQLYEWICGKASYIYL